MATTANGLPLLPSEGVDSRARTLVNLTRGAIALKTILLVAIAWSCRFVMDELALIQFIGHTGFSQYYGPVDPIKTILAHAFYLPAFAFDGSVAVALAARVIALGCALTTLYFVAVASGKHSGASPLWLCGPLVLLTFSNFIEHGTRVRTDTVALPFALGALILLIDREPDWKRHFASGLLLGGAFLCTQKAIYFAIAIGCATTISTFFESGVKRTSRLAVALFSGWLVSISVYCVVLPGAPAWRVLRAVFQGPKFVTDGTAAFQGLGVYVLQTLQRNALAYSLCLAAWLVVAYRFRIADRVSRIVALASVVLVALVFSHDQPWPYVFVWPQAFLAILVGRSATVGLEPGRRQSTWILVILALSAISLPRNFRYLSHSNAEQLRTMRVAEANLAPGDTYFDGIGMLPTRRVAGVYPYWWWDAPNLARILRAAASGDEQIPRQILSDQPKLWIYNYRFHQPARVVGSMMSGGYVRISPTIALAGATIPVAAGNFTVNVRWEGEYRVFDSDGQPTHDLLTMGTSPTRESLHLPLGETTLTLVAATRERYLLPVGSKLPLPLPVTGPAPNLYDAVYDF